MKLIRSKFAMSVNEGKMPHISKCKALITQGFLEIDFII